jgi:hypothetical protein
MLSRRLTRRLATAIVGFAVLGAVFIASRAVTVPSRQAGGQTVVSSAAVAHDTSAPLRDLAGFTAAQPDSVGEPPEVEPQLPHPRVVTVASSGAPLNPQVAVGTAAMPAATASFEGIGSGFSGPNGTFSVTSIPPDTNGDIGATQYVETVNLSLAVFDKTGTVLLGPVSIHTLWSGFGGLCATQDDGDPTVRWDALAGRWVVTQFALTHAGTGYAAPYFECIAVSQSADATGAWYRYAFQYSAFPDYPKLGVWPDAYYATFNLFGPSGASFTGGQVCAYDRLSMLTGAAATQQCFNVGTTYGGLLPSDLDGTAQPPAGAPNTILALGATTSTLTAWQFHVDFAASGNSTLTGPAPITVALYGLPCSGGGSCVPQRNTNRKLASLGDRLMYRLAYRNFGTYGSLVVAHSVGAGSSIGVRWYELRITGGTLALYQQGTYAPTSDYRWMPSIAQDRAGDMAVGYSLSSSTTYPSIAWAGRLASDPLGTLGQAESVITAGGGSQNGGYSRWGDYSSMSVDPTDGCTFWYANEYFLASSSFSWQTRINAFTYPGCGTAPVTNDFSIAASPASLSVARGASGTSTISTAIVSGSAESVALSISALPSGVTAAFVPASVTAGASSTLTLTASPTATLGSVPLTITGTAASATHTATLGLSVTAPVTNPIVNGGFETGDFTGWTRTGTTAIVTSPVHSGVDAGRDGSTAATNGDSSLAQTFTVPVGGGTLSFWYQVHCPDAVTFDWATVTLRDNTTATTTTLLPRTCTNNNTWIQVSVSLGAQAGHSVTLTLTSHDDNYVADPTYTLYDDVAMQ